MGEGRRMKRSNATLGCCAAAVALAAAAIFSSVVHAQQRATDRNLVASGFIMRIADTAAKMERLKSIPSHRFIARNNKGVRYYVYADATDCKCAFVGTQKAYDAYRELVSAPPTPPPGVRDFTVAPRGDLADHLLVHEMDEDAGLIPGNDIFHLNFQ
jgi:hypothetical protein